MPILIDNPRELGSDRLVNAVAAYERVGGRCVSVDFGTSINFDAVSADGEYLGGVIGPGLRDLDRGARRRGRRSCRGSRSPSPSRRSAATPRRRCSRASSTASPAWSTGSPRGCSPSSAPSATVIATGGLAGAIAPLCETVDEVDPYLTLKGLRLIQERNR